MKRALLLGVCGGCSQVLGLEAPTHTAAVDAAIPDVASDAPSGPCAMDTFSSPALAPMWTVNGNTSSTLVMQGQLVVIPPPQTMGGFGISTRNTLQFVGGYVEVEVAQAASFAAGQYTYFIVATSTDSLLTMMAVDNELRAVTTTNGGQKTALVPWAPGGIRYWRIAFDETRTKASFEFRNDPTATWLPITTTDFSSTPPASIGFGVVEASATNASPGEAKFDNFIAQCRSN